MANKYLEKIAGLASVSIGGIAGYKGSKEGNKLGGTVTGAIGGAVAGRVASQAGARGSAKLTGNFLPGYISGGVIGSAVGGHYAGKGYSAAKEKAFEKKAEDSSIGALGAAGHQKHALKIGGAGALTASVLPTGHKKEALLSKIARGDSEFTANNFMSQGGAKPKPMTGGLGIGAGEMGSKANILSKARQAGLRPEAKPGSVLAAVRGLRGLR